MDHTSIYEILINECLINAEKTTVVGVSGGPDSQMLLHIMYKLGFKSIVGHFDHQLRPESSKEAKLVEQMAKDLGFRFILDQNDVYRYAKRNRLSIEEAARKSRYDFLFRLANQVDAQAVAIAHNADDQVETFLMHLLRGSGLSGLRGMSYRTTETEWDDRIPLIRPILNVWREEILQYCAENQLKPIYDESNDDNTFFRNRLRNELIPYLSEYNPKIKKALWRTADIISKDYSNLKKLAAISWQECLIREGDGFVVLNGKCLRNLSKGLLRSLIRKAISTLRPGLRNIDYESIERASHFIKQPTSTKMIDLISGIEMKTEGSYVIFQDEGVIILEDEWPKVDINVLISLEIPDKKVLKDNWVVSVQYCNDFEGEIKDNDPFCVVLDAARLGTPIEVRTRKPGDRFQPLGMGGKTQKLSDFMINSQMPRRARDHWPIIFSKGKLIWIPGYRPAEYCKVQQDTEAFIKIKIYKEE